MAVVANGHVYLTNDYERQNMLRSIKTRWGNYIFRSRNEARWAVLFDALDIRFEYEPVGVELPSGKRYLPDFYIKDTGYFVDAKEEGSRDISVNNENLREALNIFNDPYGNTCLIEDFDQYLSSGLLITPSKMFLNTPDGPYGAYHERNKELEYRLYNFLLRLIGVKEDDIRFQEWNLSNRNFVHIQKAVYRAIGATFEHGEAPEPIGFRNTVSASMLLEEFGTTVIGQHKGAYLWDHMDAFQLRNL